MPQLRPMPRVTVAQGNLAVFGQRWTSLGGCLKRSPPQSSGQLGELFDKAVAEALAIMLGDIPIIPPQRGALIPPEQDCVELGPVLVVGGVRPQQFDVGYRPDGVRFAFDSKTLNDTKSVGKNWQNMVNDLGTEATTVHSRFPHAIVGFIVILPHPCLMPPQRAAITETLERLSGRSGTADPPYMAEAIAMVVWTPSDGSIDPTVPDPSSPLRIERFSEQVQTVYAARYKGLPPHAL